MVISGGSTPTEFYARLSKDEIFEHDKATFLLSDERIVSPKSKDSNVNLIENIFSDSLPLIPIVTDENYRHPKKVEEKLNSILAKSQFSPDIALLGVGIDGHTASWFPNNLYNFKEKTIGHSGQEQV